MMIINDSRVKRAGKLKAAALLVQAQLIPTLCYGMNAFICLNQRDYDQMESIYKDSLQIVLGLSQCTNKETMIQLLDNVHISQWLDVTKLKYWNKKLYSEKDVTSRLYKIWHYQMAHSIKKGIPADITKLCTKYGLPDIKTHYLDETYIMNTIKKFLKSLNMGKNTNAEKVSKVTLLDNQLHQTLLGAASGQGRCVDSSALWTCHSKNTEPTPTASTVQR